MQFSEGSALLKSHDLNLSKSDFEAKPDGSDTEQAAVEARLPQSCHKTRTATDEGSRKCLI